MVFAGLFICTALSLVGPSAARPLLYDDREAVDAFFKEAAEAGKTVSPTWPCFVEYDLRIVGGRTKAMRHQEHLKTGKPEADSSDETFRFAVWMSSDSFRASNTDPKVATTLSDIVVNGKNTWCRNATGLVLVDMAHAPPGRNFDVVKRGTGQEAISHIYGGAEGIGITGFFPSNVEVTSDKWTASASHTQTDGTVYEERYSGSFYGSGRFPVTNEVAKSVKRQGGSTSAVFRYTGWTQHPGIDRPVAEKVERFNAGQSSAARIQTLVKVEHVTAEQLRAAIAVPDFDSVDPYRGKTSIGIIEDATGSTTVFRTKDASGAIVALAQPDTPGGRADSRLRWIGWILASLLVGVLAVVVIKRRS